MNPGRRGYLIGICTGIGIDTLYDVSQRIGLSWWVEVPLLLLIFSVARQWALSPQPVVGAFNDEK